MPVEQRVVQPIYVSRGTLPVNAAGQLSINIPNELECVTNGTLANIVRQLSSLSKQADDIFSGIMSESTRLVTKSIDLQARIQRLAGKVTSLDSSVEEVSLHDIHLRKPFKSSVVFDQQVVSRDTMSAAMAELYAACDAPPPLSKLNPYREDGKDGLKFYTDPDYFFDLWRQEMLRDTERDSRDRSGKKITGGRGGKPGASPGGGGGDGKRVKRVRAPANTRERHRQMAAAHDIIIGSSVNNNQYGDTMPSSPSQQQQQQQAGAQSRRVASPQAALQPAPPPPVGVSPAPSLTSSVGSRQQPQQNMTTAQGYNNRGSAETEIATAQMKYDQSQALLMEMIASAQLPSAKDQSGTANNLSGTYQTPSPSGAYNTPPYSGSGSPRRGSTTSANLQARPSQPPPAPPPGGPISHSPSPVSSLPTGRPSSGGSRDILPPPPPPPPMPGAHVTSLTIGATVQTAVDIPPPPPPPPPSFHADSNAGSSAPPHSSANQAPQMAPPAGQTSEIKAMPTAQQLQAQVSQLRKASDRVMSSSLPPPVNDARSDLLAAIREGIKLRRVEDSKQKEVEKATPLHDVASILARRVAMEQSSDSEEEEEEDEDPWDESSES